MTDTRFKVRRNNTAGATPASIDLEIGELGLNMPDQRLFTKSADNTVFELGSGRRVTIGTSAPTTPTPINGDLWFDSTTGAKALKIFNTTWDAIPAKTLSTARTFSLTGLVTASASFDGSANCTLAVTLSPTIVIEDGFGNITQNAATATKLKTARNINGVAFDGTADITIASTAPNALTAGTYLGFASGTTYDGSVARQLVTNATALNTASTIVARDGSGNFAMGALTATGVTINGNATATGTLGVTGTITLANSLGTARHWTTSDSDIDSLVSGAQTGVLLTSAAAHFTVGLASTANTDGFQVVSKGAGSGSYTTLCFEVKADGTTTLGNVTTGTWSGTSIAATKGGTGQSTWTTGDTLYASASNTLSKLSGNTTTTKQFLSQTGNGSVSAAPVWSAVSKSDVGLGSVENTALSTWAGTANITTLGTIATGTWSASTIDITKGGTGQITASAAFNALSPMASLGDIIYGGSLGAGTRLAGNSTTTKKFLSQTGTGSASAAPTWSTVTSTDVGLANVENTALSTWAGTANITTLGTIATGTWSATAIAATKGGTAQTTWTTGDLLYASASNTLSKLSGNTTTTKQFLSQTGNGSVSAAPVWSTVSKGDVGLGNVENTALTTWAGSTSITTLGTIATGTWSASTIAVNKGGTGATTLTGYVKGSGTSALTASSTIPETDIADGSVLARLAANETIAGAWTFNDGITIAADKKISFSNSTEAKINWWGTSFVTGVQDSTLYHRSNSNHAFFVDGIHSDTALDPGAGGSLIFYLATNGAYTNVRAFDTLTTSTATDYARTVSYTYTGTGTGGRAVQVTSNFNDTDLTTAKNFYGQVTNALWYEDGISSTATAYNITGMSSAGSSGNLTYTVTCVGHPFVTGDVVAISGVNPTILDGAVYVESTATDQFTFRSSTAITYTSGGTATKTQMLAHSLYGGYNRVTPGPGTASSFDTAYGAYNVCLMSNYSHVRLGVGAWNNVDATANGISAEHLVGSLNQVQISVNTNKGGYFKKLSGSYNIINAVNRVSIDEMHGVYNLVEKTGTSTNTYVGTLYGVRNEIINDSTNGLFSTAYGFYNNFSGSGISEPTKWGIYSTGEDSNFFSAQLLIGRDVSTDSSASTAKVQINSGNTQNPLSLHRWYATAGGGGASILMCKSQSNSFGTYALVGANSLLGGIYAEGAKDSSSYGRAASLELATDSTAPSATSMPGKIKFSTTPVGSLTTSERLTIDSAGQVNVLTTTDATSATTGSLITDGGLGVAKAIYAGTSILSVSSTAGVGYATGAGGTVTQGTSKSTGVTLSKVCGTITMHNAALAADTTVTFTLTNTAIAATDLIIINHTSGGTAGAYLVNAQVASGSATINVRNITAGSLSEAIVLRFAVIKAVTS